MGAWGKIQILNHSKSVKYFNPDKSRAECFASPVNAMHLVRLVAVLGPLQLDFEPLHAYLESIHSLDSCLGTGGVVKAHKACKTRIQTYRVLSQIAKAISGKAGMTKGLLTNLLIH